MNALPRRVVRSDTMRCSRVSASTVIQRASQFVVPILLPLFASAIPPAIGVRRRIRSPVTRPTRTLRRCDYDLRTSPGRFAECGAEPTLLI